MSVKVVARVRPLLRNELEKDRIVKTACDSSNSSDAKPILIRIPNPKNAAESFRFQFSSVYDSDTTQQQLFDNEISPTVKHLFSGLDVTIFAYGVTGTGKTHTMRGGKSLADRGVIPRLLSSIYRKGRKIEKDSNGSRQVVVSLSYYEIYCDKVFDLFEPPEKRTLAGLPIRDTGGRTVVAGLTERPCTTLREFEQLYNEANVNRSTSSTKLNAHSSRSHAILCVKVSQVSEDSTIISTASAIDLAGSEDNRRTDNDKERLVESSSINKSLFVLAQCVEAISKKQSRIPYRESKMTRILSLGQNKGLTIMILNLAPVKSYHLDTLSSLTVANRTKKIEVREVENEPMFKGAGKVITTIKDPSVNRQPLTSLCSNVSTGLNTTTSQTQKPVKAFSVYAENRLPSKSVHRPVQSLKRVSNGVCDQQTRPSKISRSMGSENGGRTKGPEISRAALEELVNRMVEEKLASRVQQAEAAERLAASVVSSDLQQRLEALEQRIECKDDDGRAEGLQFLLMAKQHQLRGEDHSALKMYALALPYFPNNEKLAQKMALLERKLASGESDVLGESAEYVAESKVIMGRAMSRKRSSPAENDSDEDYVEHQDADETIVTDHNARSKRKGGNAKSTKMRVFNEQSSDQNFTAASLTPRSAHLLDIINSRDVGQIKQLKGVGAKRAENIVSCLCALDAEQDGLLITDLEQLGALKGVGAKTLECMRAGITF